MPVMEHSGPPPFASGEDWRAYFRQYRAGLDAKKRAAAEKAQRILESGKFSITQQSHLVSIDDLVGGAATFAKMIAAGNTKRIAAGHEPWVIEARRSATHHAATLYLEDAKSKNENDEKGHVAGDVRFPAHNEFHQAVGVVAGRDSRVALRIEVHWSQIVNKAGSKDGSVAFKFAKTFIVGLGWDYFQSATEFTEWQYVAGLKARPKPKAALPAEDGVWQG